MRRYFVAHLPVVVFYFLVLIGVRFLRVGLESSLIVDGVSIFLGILVGVLILFLDRVVYTYSYPQEQLSQHFVYLWKQRQYFQGFALLDSRRSEQEKLTFRSGLFIVIWIPLAFFTLTSTTSLFGKAVVMGLMLHILYDAWRLQRMASDRLNTRFFWQIARPVTHEEQLIFLWIITGIFILFSMWLG